MIRFAQIIRIRIKDFVSIIQLESFDTTTKQGRSKERHRRVGLSALTSVMAQGINTISTIITVPLTLQYLGMERYGLWVTISSLISFLSFADLGMGNALINAISEANGKDNQKMAAEYVSTAFFLLIGIGILLGVIFFILYPLVQWSSIFNVFSTEAKTETGPTIAILISCFLLNLPLGIIQKIYMGYQEGYINSIWQSAGKVLALISIIIVIFFKAGLPWLMLAMMGAPIITLSINGVILFYKNRPWLRPIFKYIRKPAFSRILRTGFLFVTLQLSSALGYQSDNLVISHYLGPDNVANYAIPLKLFMIAPLLLSFVFTPLWPAYGEAITRGDTLWARKTFGRSIFLGLAINLPSSILLIVFGTKIIHIWAGNEITPTFSLLIGFAIWTILNSFNGPIAMLLNGANIIGFQVICALLMAASNLSLSILLVQRFGLIGPIFGSIISQTLFIILPFIIYAPIFFRSLQAKSSNLI